MALPSIYGLMRIHTIEIKYLQDGTPLLNMNVVSSSKYKTKAGEDREDTCWITATAFAKQAENIHKFFKEKDRILLSGKLKQDNWTNPAGEKRSKHVLKIDSFEFVEKRDSVNQPQQGYSTSQGMNDPSSQQHAQYNQQQNPPPAQHHDMQNENTTGNGYPPTETYYDKNGQPIPV